MSEHPGDVLISATGLTKVFATRGGPVTAVDQVDLELPVGRCLAVVGQSGSGKSTLARLLLRLIEPSGGSLTYRGEDLLALKGGALRRQRRHAQMVFQSPYSSLLPTRTVLENVVEPLRIHRVGNPATRVTRALELLDLVRLSKRQAETYPRRLSGGQQQRVAIARALALQPELLVCDEPTSALDVSIQAQILLLLSELQEELGFSMLFITHNLAVAQRLADQIMVMEGGRVVETSATASLFADPQHGYTKQLLGSSLPVRADAS